MILDQYTRESLGGRLRGGLVNGEVFEVLAEAWVLGGSRRMYVDAERPHRALGHRPPAPETTAA